jgi:ribonuclease P/MRP protein subunit POP3
MFALTRPSIAANVENNLLARLVHITEGVSDYHLERERQSKRKRRDRASQKRRNLPQSALTSKDQEKAPDANTAAAGVLASNIPAGLLEIINDGHASDPAQPEILKHLVIGVNEVTKRLERQSKMIQQIRNTSSPGNSDEDSLIGVIFVCKGDIDPPMLVSHLATLVASYNLDAVRTYSPQMKPPPHIKLIPFSKGIESSLAAAMGLRRVAVMAVNVCYRPSFRQYADFPK